MNDARLRLSSFLTSIPHQLPMVLAPWRWAWRAARAAEDAYERARCRGLPRDAAASNALLALNSDGPPISPAPTAEIRAAPDTALVVTHVRSPGNAIV